MLTAWGDEMKYIVEVKEWENEGKTWRNFGNREALNFIEHALRCASWNELKEMEEAINKYICEQNPMNNNESFCDKRCNPMLTIVSALRNYEKLAKYIQETNPDKLKEFYAT